MRESAPAAERGAPVRDTAPRPPHDDHAKKDTTRTQPLPPLTPRGTRAAWRRATRPEGGSTAA